ncbi:carbohydrate ABC transporter permease [Paenibacillus eucommiae]|uniref:Aldouronate transport system permease protein n=1 Tax=Paenibacillus eucommiae TaxID=1355755 RepID=A0ABS4IVT9_9BACL|nr:carbohydrate ABC transporter permease [Paenibacillus eucommiae]MBP1991700.1 putative aldouronate transport system permease protein [Paenibacillus eucommiae]
MIADKSFGSRLFDLLNIAFLSLLSLITLLPFIYIIAASLAAPEEVLTKRFMLFPSKFDFSAYQYILSTNTILKSLWVSISLTAFGTLFNLILTSLMAYPLARRDFGKRRIILLLVVFSMIFNGGMIPTFLVVKSVGLIDSYMSLILPTAISAFYLIVLKNFFQQLPDGLEESAKIDGCNDLQIFYRIVLPLSKPALATIGLFYAVDHWNSYFNAILYINDTAKWPVQVLLRQIVIMSQGGIGDSTQFADNFTMPPPVTIKMAVIVVSMIPILCVYPFLQKYFTKGIFLGSVKG